MEDTTNYLPQAFVRWAKTQEDPTLVGSVLLTILGKDIPLSPKGEAYADVFSLEYTRMQEEMSAKDARRKEQNRVAQRKSRSKKASDVSKVSNVSNVSNTDITLQTDIT